jgi:dipeptidase E
MKNILLASTSTVYGSGFLDYLLPELEQHFKDCNTLLFIPYARSGGMTHEEYTAKVALAFAKINIAVKGIHEFENPAGQFKMLKEFLPEEEIRLFWFPNCTKIK